MAGLAYTEKKVEDIREQTSLDDYLMLLHDKHFDCVVGIRPEAQILTDERMMNLLANLSLSGNQEVLTELIRCDKGCLVTKDDGRIIVNQVDEIPFSDYNSDVVIKVYDRENEEWIDIALFSVAKDEYVSAVRIEEEIMN